MLQLGKQTYELTESGNYWRETLHDQRKKNLCITEIIENHALLFKRGAKRRFGPYGSYV